MGNLVRGLDMRSLKVIGLWQLIVSTRGGRDGDGGAEYFVTVNALLMSLFFSYVIVQLVSFSFHYDFVMLMEKISVNITLIESILKFFYCCTRRWHLGHLSQVFEVDFMQCASHDRVNSERILDKSSKMLTKNINIFIILIYATVAVWNSLPIFNCFTENECDNISIMPSWYPMSTAESPTKQLVYLAEFTIMCYCASLLYNINCLLLSFARLLASQICVLKSNLARLQVNATRLTRTASRPLLSSDRKAKLDKVKEDFLKACLMDHQKIIRFAALMEKVFSPLFLFQIVVSTMTLCLVCISLTAQTSDTVDSTMSLAMTFKFMLYLAVGVMELLVYCWCGHIVLEETKSLHYSFYETCWINGSANFKRNILMATTKTTRPSYFTAGKFCSIDLNTFASVMKASFSYFTFLHGINSKK